MDNPETQATLGTDTERRKQTKNTEKSKDEQPKNPTKLLYDIDTLWQYIYICFKHTIN